MGREEAGSEPSVVAEAVERGDRLLGPVGYAGEKSSTIRTPATIRAMPAQAGERILSPK
jgi:hypothetical protein